LDRDKRLNLQIADRDKRMNLKMKACFDQIFVAAAAPQWRPRRTDVNLA